MRLVKFEARNFKGLECAAVEWEDFLVLIGDNNCGKSSVLQALNIFLGGSQIKDQLLFREGLTSETNAIELTGHFDSLTSRELNSTAVKGRTHEDKWILKKRFWQEEGEDGGWKELYYSYYAEDDFVGWPDSDGSWNNFPAQYQPMIQLLPNKGKVPNKDTKAELKELIRLQSQTLVKKGPPGWLPNPGGGGNWKSNANSILPRSIWVKAVHDVNTEATSKDAAAFGRILNLIIEKKMMKRPELQALQQQLDIVMKLFRRDPDEPKAQAQEIQEIQGRINAKLSEVISAIVSFETDEVDLPHLLLPNTTLKLRDHADGIETTAINHGHGLQRTTILTLLQVLAEVEAEEQLAEDGISAGARPVIFAIDEPELYMHPQMERKMRDVLMKLARQPNIQVICTTHSPVFLDFGSSHRSIVRVAKHANRQVQVHQVTCDLYDANDAEAQKDRLRFLASFHPTAAEVFFAKRVVLLEERTALCAFQRAAELTGLYERHPACKWDVTFLDCEGKTAIPQFQAILNHFQIPYVVIHDEDAGDDAEKYNDVIAKLLTTKHWTNLRHLISPKDFETLLGHTVSKRDGKAYSAVQRVEELHRQRKIPSAFTEALNFAFFGQLDEPAPEIRPKLEVTFGSSVSSGTTNNPIGAIGRS